LHPEASKFDLQGKHSGVKCPSGRLGKRSELNENTKLARIGANTNAKTTKM
jgi:hypothetical protein